MVKIAVLFVTFFALSLPSLAGVAFACDEPGDHDAKPQEMRPEQEADIVPTDIVIISGDGVEVSFEVDQPEGNPVVRLASGDDADRSFALAALAPVLFALVTVAAYALLRRKMD